VTLVSALAGAALIVFVLVDVFEAVVLPRRVTRPYRLARLFFRSAWWVWCLAADRVRGGRVRAGMLGGFGPLSLLTLFALWALGMVAGFGLLHHALAPDERSIGESFYLSGTTFTTLGYGDVTPIGAADRTLAVAEALVGFGFFALVIGYLPVFYQAFSRRELAISLLDARAGSPPCGGELLIRMPPNAGGALTRFLEEAERWAAELLESQLSYPVLSFYRSQHDNQSWLAALTCALDASALLLTVVTGADRAQARLTFAMARHALVDVALVLNRRPRHGHGDRLPDERMNDLLAALRAGGVPVRVDDTACAKLRELRGLYEPFANALAAYLRLNLPPVWPGGGGPDNWQTSAGMRRAAGLTHLAAPGDDHFE
jgi:hypothetical protein